LHFWHSFLTVPNSWHRAAFIFCLCTDPGASPGGLESGVRQFISPRLNHWFFTISTAWFRCDVALEREIPLGDSIARSWLHLAECCGSVLSSVAKLDNATHFDVLARTKHRLHPSGDKVHGQLNTPPRVPGTDLDLQFASIRPPHSRCLARMALYAWGKLFHSNELSPLLSLFRSLSRGSIISLYWSLRRLTHLGSNLPGLLPTRHCDMQRRIWRSISSGVLAEKHATSQFERMY
jgi:hypothetical protein